MNAKLAITIAILIVVLNALLGHFLAPFEILLTPFVLPITAALINFATNNIRCFPRSLLTFLCIALNDILIKLYGGGKHDSEGQGWITMMLFIGTVPAFIILSLALFKHKEEKIAHKILSLKARLICCCFL